VLLPFFLSFLVIIHHPALFVRGCMHDDVQARTDVIVDPAPAVGVRSARQQAAAFGTGFKPLRIVLDTSRLEVNGDSQTKYCTSCTDGLTPEKRDFLVNTLLPKMTSWHSQSLTVSPSTAPLVFSGSTTCGEVTNIGAPFTTVGVEGDVIIFVQARATPGKTLAYASYCRLTTAGRPWAGYINFGPANIDPTPTALWSQLTTAIHEAAHLLGFSSTAFANYKDKTGAAWSGGITAPATVNGVQRTLVKSPRVLEIARAHYNCPTLAGVELENNGGQGTAGSHWEARIVDTEVMAGRTSNNLGALSALTLALFEDSGWYLPNYSVLATFGTPRWDWGRGAGCAFLGTKCSDWPADYGFCTKPNANGCTLSGYKGYCGALIGSTAAAPEYTYVPSQPNLVGQDEMMDSCPLMRPYSNGACSEVANAPTTNSFGEFYSTDSTSCFMGNTLLADYFSPSDQLFNLCMRFECKGPSELWVAVDKDLQPCPGDGGKITTYGPTVTKGRYIQCPANITQFCSLRNSTAFIPPAAPAPSPSLTSFVNNSLTAPYLNKLEAFTATTRGKIIVYGISGLVFVCLLVCCYCCCCKKKTRKGGYEEVDFQGRPIRKAPPENRNPAAVQPGGPPGHHGNRYPQPPPQRAWPSSTGASAGSTATTKSTGAKR
jgi:hypothetical protein